MNANDNDQFYEEEGYSSPDEYMDGDNDNESGEEAVDEAQELREQLCDIPLGEIKKLKDKVGLKKYNQVLFGTSKEDDGGHSEGTTTRKKTIVDNRRKEFGELKKKTKSEPLEVSSKKRQFSKPRMVVKNDKRSTRDPRFSDLSGEYNEDLFQKSYTFIDEMKKKEYDMLNKQLKKVKNPEQKNDLLMLKSRLDNEQKLEADKLKRRELKKQQRANIEQETQAGKKPYYLKKSDQKKIELAEKFRELKSTGKLEKFMQKKRKRNAQKDKKNLPDMKM